ncbi:ATP synthase subunit alpha [Dorcoceras hygrometricum]|uniref:ATP synthase subunit alpha n=1 Tax=Dorcoceras hygrometricum TaxID=472368 RepID=A0A2Z7AB76_9LAMI|nr:ATP synthase subunit alpha [Dorcoceras hygrometricum]
MINHLHDPWAFYHHAALFRQSFVRCEKFSIDVSYRNLGRVSVPVWLLIFSDQLLIIVLVGDSIIITPISNKKSC